MPIGPLSKGFFEGPGAAIDGSTAKLFAEQGERLRKEIEVSSAKAEAQAKGPILATAYADAYTKLSQGDTSGFTKLTNAAAEASTNPFLASMAKEATKIGEDIYASYRREEEVRRTLAAGLEREKMQSLTTQYTQHQRDVRAQKTQDVSTAKAVGEAQQAWDAAETPEERKELGLPEQRPADFVPSPTPEFKPMWFEEGLPNLDPTRTAYLTKAEAQKNAAATNDAATAAGVGAGPAPAPNAAIATAPNPVVAQRQLPPDQIGEGAPPPVGGPPTAPPGQEGAPPPVKPVSPEQLAAAKAAEASLIKVPNGPIEWILSPIEVPEDRTKSINYKGRTISKKVSAPGKAQAELMKGVQTKFLNNMEKVPEDFKNWAGTMAKLGYVPVKIDPDTLQASATNQRTGETQYYTEGRTEKKDNEEKVVLHWSKEGTPILLTKDERKAWIEASNAAETLGKNGMLKIRGINTAKPEPPEVREAKEKEQAEKFASIVNSDDVMKKEKIEKFNRDRSSQGLPRLDPDKFKIKKIKVKGEQSEEKKAEDAAISEALKGAGIDISKQLAQEVTERTEREKARAKKLVETVANTRAELMPQTIRDLTQKRDVILNDIERLKNQEGTTTVEFRAKGRELVDIEAALKQANDTLTEALNTLQQAKDEAAALENRSSMQRIKEVP